MAEEIEQIYSKSLQLVNLKKETERLTTENDIDGLLRLLAENGYKSPQQVTQELLKSLQKLRVIHTRIEPKEIDRLPESVLARLNSCPHCYGIGLISNTIYQREDGRVIPILASKSCPYCHNATQ